MNLLPLTNLFFKCLQLLSLSQAKAESAELVLDLLHGWQEPKHTSHSWVFAGRSISRQQDQKQSKASKPGELICDVGILNSILTAFTKCSSLTCVFLISDCLIDIANIKFSEIWCSLCWNIKAMFKWCDYPNPHNPYYVNSLVTDGNIAFYLKFNG